MTQINDDIVKGRIWGGSKAPKEPPGLHRGFLEPPVDLVGKNFNLLLLAKEVAVTFFTF